MKINENAINYYYYYYFREIFMKRNKNDINLNYYYYYYYYCFHELGSFTIRTNVMNICVTLSEMQ
jgi:hypothetical protein